MQESMNLLFLYFRFNKMFKKVVVVGHPLLLYAMAKKILFI